MKHIKAALISCVLLTTVLSGVAGAQSSYEGTTLEDGIFFVPDNPTGGENVNLAVAGLEPNATVTVILVDPNNSAVDGLDAEVASAIGLQADATGAININFTLPENLAPGTYSLVANSTRADGSPFQATWDFIIVAQAAAGGSPDAAGATAAPAATTTDQAAGNLALTGASSRVTAVGGGILVVLGLGLVVVAATSRRRDAVTT